jgi:tetratricopeptide (TPR) repeat protein
MRQRDIIKTIAVSWPLGARVQQGKQMRQVGPIVLEAKMYVGKKIGYFLTVFIAAVFLSFTVDITNAQPQVQANRCKNGPTSDLAISACSELIQSGGLSKQALATAFYNRGYWYAVRKKEFDRADWNMALEDFTQSIRLDPTKPSTFNNRCEARAKLGLLQAALSDCNESLRLRPNDPDTLDNRGFTYLRLSDLDRAIADYNAALKLNPKISASLYGRGVAKLKKGNNADGNADIDAAKAIKADIAEEYAQFGVKP